jgi:hypothetical protein
MFKSACDMVKMSVMLSAFFFTMGALLEILAQILTAENMIPIYFSYIGIFAMLIGFIVLFVTLIAVLIPKVNQHLQSCQH